MCLEWFLQPNIIDFNLIQNIAMGGFAQVFQGIHKQSNTPVSIKKISRAAIGGCEKSLQLDLEKYLKVQHENKLHLYGWFKDANNYYLVSKPAKHGSLRATLSKSRFDSQKSAHLIKQLTMSLMHSHEQGLVHGNLKSENVLFGGSGRVKVTDHGLSKYYPKSIKGATSDNRSYIAPELALGKSHSRKVDNWSLGVILFESVTGKHPMSLVGAGNYDKISGLVKSQNISEYLKDLLLKLLVVEPKARLSLRAVLRHAWVVKYTSGKYAHCRLVC